MSGKKDRGDGLGESEGGLVTLGGMTDLKLVVPKMKVEDHVPRTLLFLTAILLRYHQDPEFVEENIQWFMDQSRN